METVFPQSPYMELHRGKGLGVTWTKIKPDVKQACVCVKMWVGWGLASRARERTFSLQK